MGLRHRAGGRGGGRGPPGGRRRGAGVPGAKGRRGPGTNRWRAPPGGHRGLGSGWVRAPYQPGRRPPAPYALPAPEPCAAQKRRPLRGFGCRPAVRLVPGGGLRLPERAAAVLGSAPRGGLGAGPQQHQGDARFQPCPAAGVLQAQRPGRSRARGQGCALRVAGAADAGRRRGLARHPDEKGPLAHARRSSRAGGGRRPPRSACPRA